VEEGAVVGQVGPSGEVEHAVPYVHLGVRRTAEADGYLDPLGFLPPRAPAKASAATTTEPAPAPAPGSAPAPKTGPAVPAAAAPEMPHASASSSRNGQPAHGDHVMTRSERPEVVRDTAPRAAGTVTARDAATAPPRGDSPAPSTSRRTVPGSFEIPASEVSASAAPNVLDRPAQGDGAQAVPTGVVLLTAGLCLAVLAAVGIAAVRPRRADGSSPETACAPSLAPERAQACEPAAVSAELSARPPSAASPRCALRGRPHRSRRRRTELVAAS
jgi:hypothetical protein